jgi:intein/homing endonuclease
MSGINKRLYKISLEGGHEYYCTAEHEWPIWSHKNKKFEKKQTQQILVGDLLPVIQNKKLFDSQMGSYSNGRDLASKDYDYIIANFNNVLNFSEDFRKGFISGIIDRCGVCCINSKEKRMQSYDLLDSNGFKFPEDIISNRLEYIDFRISNKKLLKLISNLSGFTFESR